MIQEISSGIVPIQFKNTIKAKKVLEDAMVYLVQLKSGNHYSFPKGHLHPGEDFLTAAKRELFEETHLEVKELLLEKHFEEKYIIIKQDVEVSKKVVFFVAEVKGDAEIDPSEIIEGKWVPLLTATNILTYPSSKKTCLEVINALKAKYPMHS